MYHREALAQAAVANITILMYDNYHKLLIGCWHKASNELSVPLRPGLLVPHRGLTSGSGPFAMSISLLCIDIMPIGLGVHVRWQLAALLHIRQNFNLEFCTANFTAQSSDWYQQHNIAQDAES